MALRAGYYGIKNALLKKLEGLTNAVVIKSIGEGLDLSAAGELSNTSTGGLDYSTTEQDTGLKWYDGSGIFVKTISSDITNISTSINHEITNLDKVIDIKAIAELVSASSGKSAFNAMRIAIGSGGSSVEPTYSNIVNSITDTAIDIRVGSQVVNTANYSKVTVYVTLYYTKKTAAKTTRKK